MSGSFADFVRIELSLAPADTKQNAVMPVSERATAAPSTKRPIPHTYDMMRLMNMLRAIV